MLIKTNWMRLNKRDFNGFGKIYIKSTLQKEKMEESEILEYFPKKYLFRMHK